MHTCKQTYKTHIPPCSDTVPNYCLPPLLTDRANLRHFPDMARGYLMWFYYNGFIHFAGQYKHRQAIKYKPIHTICGAVTTLLTHY